MRGWRLLTTKLESLLEEWPRELIPLLADYVRARRHEWRIHHSDGCLITKSVVEMFVGLPPPHIVAFRHFSKYSLENGPRTWAVDIEFSNWQRDVYIWVGLYQFPQDDAFDRDVSGMSFVQRYNHLHILYDGVAWKDAATNRFKHRIFVTILQDQLIFEYWDESYGSLMRCLGSIPVEERLNFDVLYPAISITSGAACTITWVDD
jgi:hypothetical protein